MDMEMFDIGNVYPTAAIHQQQERYMTLGPEFGKDEGEMDIIVRAIYGLNISGAAYRNHLEEILIEMGFDSCLADADM